MDFPKAWYCEKCGCANYQHSIIKYERNNETFIQCQTCKHEMIMADVEFELEKETRKRQSLKRRKWLLQHVNR